MAAGGPFQDMQLEREASNRSVTAQRGSQWLRAVGMVATPAVIASAGYAAVFSLALPRATDAVLMLWSLSMTFMASRAMTNALREAAQSLQQHRNAMPDE